MEIIEKRRSIRRYSQRQVDRELVHEVLQLAGQAPSWKNLQPWRFILVDDPEVKRALADCIPEGNPGKPAVIQAPCVVAVVGNPDESGVMDDRPYYLVDCGIAFATLMLAAKDRGLDTCFVGYLDETRALDVMGVPSPFRLVGLTPLGYGEPPEKKRPRRPLKENAFINRFGKEIS